MKKNYEAPELNITVFFTSSDIILASGEDDKDKDVKIEFDDLWG